MQGISIIYLCNFVKKYIMLTKKPTSSTLLIFHSMEYVLSN